MGWRGLTLQDARLGIASLPADGNWVVIPYSSVQGTVHLDHRVSPIKLNIILSHCLKV